MPIAHLLLLSALAALPLRAALSINVSSFPDGNAGLQYSYRIPVSGGTGAVQCWTSDQEMPGGTYVNPQTCEVTGNPYHAGLHSILLVATSGTERAERRITWLIREGIRITYPDSTDATQGRVGKPFAMSPTILGGSPPYTFSLDSGSLPPGILLNGSTGVLSGGRRR
jgi:hypothetical protein